MQQTETERETERSLDSGPAASELELKLKRAEVRGEGALSLADGQASLRRLAPRRVGLRQQERARCRGKREGAGREGGEEGASERSVWQGEREGGE